LKSRILEDGIEGSLSEHEVLQMRKFYYGEVAFVDYCFGVFISYLEKRGLLENTIVAFLSDHGTHLGEQNIVQKRTFFDVSAKVPFFVKLPTSFSSIPNRTISTPVETLSFLPTLLDLCNLEVPSRQFSSSLVPIMMGGAATPLQSVISQIAEGNERLVMVRQENLKLILNVDDSSEIPLLIDLDRDPFELENRYAEADYQERLVNLTQSIQDCLVGSDPILPLYRHVANPTYSTNGSPLCPTCGQNDRAKPLHDPALTNRDWSSYECSHCGQKFLVPMEKKQQGRGRKEAYIDEE
jgi:arylsulfatase A-like enzyme